MSGWLDRQRRTYRCYGFEWHSRCFWGGLRGPTAPTNPLLALDSCEAISDVRYELDAGRGFVNVYGRVVVLRACVENSQHFRSRKVDGDMATGVAMAALVACARCARIGRSGRRFGV